MSFAPITFISLNFKYCDLQCLGTENSDAPCISNSPCVGLLGKAKTNDHLFLHHFYFYFLLCVQAGHPFQQRCAQSAYSNGKPRSEAPVFLLFLDCVWQILRQFPCSFQFNEHFLVTLFEHAYASQFGTFLGNSAAERSVIHCRSFALNIAGESDQSLLFVKSMV